MHDFINELLTLPEFDSRPPVLVDIGASGEINHKWEQIAKYSVCIAFDADQRDMDYITAKSSDYRQLYIYKCIVSSTSQPILDFYLTKSPHCSSLLQPNIEELKSFIFSPLFEIEKVEQVSSRELRQILEEINIDYVDWFKSDSQGIDLRLFKNLGQDIIETVLVAEFEPGIIDAYYGEDKLYDVMAYMDTQGFWMSNIEVKGSIRANLDLLGTEFNSFEQHCFSDLHRKTPGWAEVRYFRKQIPHHKRTMLLAWLFAILDEQYGFALEIAHLGKNVTHDLIFEELIRETVKRFRVSYRQKWHQFALNKVLKKLKLLFYYE